MTAFSDASEKVVADSTRIRDFTTSPLPAYTDANGVERRTVAGINDDADALLLEKSGNFDERIAEKTAEFDASVDDLYAARDASVAARDASASFAEQAAGNVNFTVNRSFAVNAVALGNIAGTYDNAAGTITGTGALPSQDGVAPGVGNVYALMNQASRVQNGYYTLTAANPYVLTRHPLADTGAELAGACVNVIGGTQFASWTIVVQQTAITLGTTEVSLAMRTGGLGVEAELRARGDSDILLGLALSGDASGIIQSVGNPAISGTAATPLIFAFRTVASRGGYARNLQIYGQTAGTIIVHSLSGNGGASFSKLQSRTITLSAGLNTFTRAQLADLFIPKNGTLAIELSSGNGAFSYTSMVAEYYSVATSVGSTFTFNAPTNARLNFSYEIESTASYKLPRTSLEPALVTELDGYGTNKAKFDPINVVTEPTTATQGKASGTVAVSPASTAYNLLAFNNTPAISAGTVSTLNAHIVTVGDGTLLIKVIDSAFKVLSQQAVTGITSTGWQALTLSTPMSVPKEGFVGYQSLSTGAIVRYDSFSGSSPYYYLNGNPSVGATFTPTGQATTQSGLFFNFVLDYTKTYIPSAYLDPAFAPASGGISQSALSADASLEMVQNFASLPSGWSNGGSSWTFSGSGYTGKASGGATGLANQLRTGRQYGLDRRRMRWEFEITNASTVVQFLTNPIEGAVRSGSMIQIDAAAGTLAVMEQYTGLNTPVALTTQTMGFTLAVGQRYVFEWTKNQRSFTARLTNVYNPKNQDFSYSRTVSAWGFTTHPSAIYDQGTMQGAPGVAYSAGGIDIYSFNHDSLGSLRPWLYILGDSITEGFGVPDGNTLTALLRQDFGTDRVLASGIGSAVTTGAYARIQSELVNIRPANVLVFLGSNGDGSFSSGMSNIVSFAQTLGCKVYAATVPSSSSNTAIVNALPASVVKVDWAAELTQSGAGSTRIAAYYQNTDNAGNSYNDNLHPNSLGDIKRRRRLMVDAPLLYAN